MAFRNLDEIGENPELREVTDKLAQLLDGADPAVLAGALQTKNLAALAKSLKLTEGQLSQLAEEVGGVVTKMNDRYPEIAKEVQQEQQQTKKA
jgi:hypothetical protein